MASVFSELKRRNVFRVAGVYAVVGWLLAQIATTLEEAMGLPSWFDGLIIACLLIGLPIALVFAWAFELTPEGVVKTEAVPKGESITDVTGRKLDVAIIVGLALLGGMLVWQQLAEGPAVDENPAQMAGIAEPGETSAASIAVLPFADLSPGGDQEYFSDGIAEEILNVLVGVDGLNVTSRTSSFQFKGGDLGIPEIATRLKVRHVVEGSVRKSGETIRVTAQLIDASNDKHLWSETYDRPLTAENIFEIQDDIANSIVEALSNTLGVGVLDTIEISPSTRNVTAYELYLQARPLFLARQDLDVADQLLEEALSQDPEFARAWEMRAALQLLRIDYGYSKATLEEGDRVAGEFARRALEIEPRSALAMAVIAMSKSNAAAELRNKAKLVEIAAMFDQALEIEPNNASALIWRGRLYLGVGELDAALADFRACKRYEPFYSPCVMNTVLTLAALGRDGESLEAFEEALDFGVSGVVYANLPLLARMEQDLAFKLVTNSSVLLRGWRRHDELLDAYRNPDSDHSELIQSIRTHLEKQGTRERSEFSFITQPIGGDKSIPDINLRWGPAFRQYRQTEAFKTYIREAGIFEYWQQVRFPPQCRPVDDDDFECD